VSVNDQWVHPHEQVLNVLIACQSYGPDKPSSMPSIDAWICPTASTVVLGEKLGMDPQIGPSMCFGSGLEPFFSKQLPCSSLLTTTQKVAMRRPHEIRMVECHTRTERGMRVVCWSGFPCRVYVDLNHRDSQI
jgi:hypothetical protein